MRVSSFSSTCPSFATNIAYLWRTCWTSFGEMRWEVSCQLDTGGVLAGCSDLHANDCRKSDQPSSGFEPSSQRPIGVFRPPLFPLRATMMALPGLLPPRCMAPGMGSSAQYPSLSIHSSLHCLAVVWAPSSGRSLWLGALPLLQEEAPHEPQLRGLLTEAQACGDGICSALN